MVDENRGDEMGGVANELIQVAKEALVISSRSFSAQTGFDGLTSKLTMYGRSGGNAD